MHVERQTSPRIVANICPFHLPFNLFLWYLVSVICRVSTTVEARVPSRHERSCVLVACNSRCICSKLVQLGSIHARVLLQIFFGDFGGAIGVAAVLEVLECFVLIAEEAHLVCDTGCLLVLVLTKRWVKGRDGSNRVQLLQAMRKLYALQELFVAHVVHGTILDLYLSVEYPACTGRRPAKNRNHMKNDR